MADQLSMLNPSRCEQASYRETRYRIDVERGTTIEQIKHPMFWAHVARKLKAHDTISVVSEDNAFWAELVVLSVGKERAFVAVVKMIDVNAEIEKLLQLEGAVVKDDTVARVVWKSAKAKWCVVRGETLVRSGFVSEVEANNWLATGDVKAA
jgi:hypothetical protein